MNQQELKQRFEQLFTEYSEGFSEGFAREGSVVVDQVINPLVMVMTPVYDRIADVVEQANPPSGGASGDTLDAIGERLLAPRSEGAKAEADIRLVFAERTEVSLPAGSSVYAGDREFQTTRDARFAPEQLARTEQDNVTAYETPPVPVEAVEAGGEYEVGADAIRTPSFTLPQLIGVYNPAPSTSGTTDESDANYRQRLRQSVSSRAMDTEDGARFLVGDEFAGDVTEIELITPGDDEMQRDAQYVQRVVGESPLSVDITLERSSGSTDAVNVSVNETTATANPEDGKAVVTGYNSDTKTITHTNVVSDVAAGLAPIPFGAFVTLFVPAGTDANLEGWSSAEERLGANQRPGDTEGDYVLFARKGDLSLVPRQRSVDLSAGTTTVSFDTTLFEQTVSPFRSRHLIGFENKTAGSTTPNPSRLLKRTQRNKTEPPDAFEEEATQKEYNDLSRPDFSSLVVGTDVLFAEDFQRDQSMTMALGNGWFAGNTGEKFRAKDVAAGVFTGDGQLLMGPRNLRQKQEGGAIEAPPTLNYATTQADKERAQEVDQMLQSENISSELRRRVIDSITRPREYPTNGYRGIENNTSPVVQRKLSQPYGFRMKGVIQTTDDEHPACVTMSRSENPEALSSVGRGAPKFRWYEGYGFALQADTEGAPNVFIIDNASAARQMTVVGEEYVNGKLNFNTLNQTHLPIETETPYRYEMTVGTPADGDHGMTLTVRIWEEGETRPTTPTIEYGAYVPENRRDTLLVPNEGSFTTPSDNPIDATHIGVGVSSTGGTEYWTLSDFEVENVQQSYAQAVAELDVSSVNDTAEMKIVARGKGYKGGAEEVVYGYDVYAWNEQTDEWDEVYVKKARPSTYRYWTSRLSIDLVNHVTPEGRLRLLITSPEPHEGPAANPETARLELDYIKGSNYDQVTHTGGKADLFFVQSGGTNQRPSTKTTTNLELTGDEMVYTMSAEDFGGPVSEVLNVYFGSGTDSPVLEEGSEYRYFWRNPAERGSMNEELQFIFGPVAQGTQTTLTIEARVHTRTQALDEFITNSPKRKIDSDLLARHKQPVFVDVDMSMSGTEPPAPSQIIRQMIREYNGNDIGVADIAARLVKGGADTVDTSTATLTARRIDDEGNPQTEDVEVARRSRTETFVPGTITIRRNA